MRDLQDMTLREANEWAAFEEAFGPLTIHERVDYMGALVSYIIASAMSGKKMKFDDFVPKWGKKEKTDLFSFLKGEAHRNPSNPRR